MDFSAKPEWGLIKINKLDKHQVEKSDPLKKKTNADQLIAYVSTKEYLGYLQNNWNEI